MTRIADGPGRSQENGRSHTQSEFHESRGHRNGSHVTTNGTRHSQKRIELDGRASNGLEDSRIVSHKSRIAPETKVAKLAARFESAVPREIVALKRLVAGLRDQDVQDKSKFCRAINGLLRRSAFRALLQDGRYALFVHTKTGASGGYIQFKLSTGGSFGRLGRDDFSLVSIAGELAERLPPRVKTRRTKDASHAAVNSAGY